MKKYVFLIGFFCALFPVAASAAVEAKPKIVAEWKQEGSRFIIRQVSIVQFLNSMPSPSAGQEPQIPLTLTAITFEFHNTDQNRKIDLRGDFQFQLTDEFNNTYRSISRNFSSPKTDFPLDLTPSSLYPNSFFRKTVFFEMPIAASRKLTLRINATNAGIPQPFGLEFPRAQIQNLIAEDPKRLPNEEEFQVLAPLTGTMIRPGAVVHIGLRLPDEVRPPNKIYIISPNFVFEDTGSKYQYDLRIPHDQPQGPFLIVVMGKWGTDRETIFSRSFTLEVVNNSKDNQDEFSTGVGTPNI